jgi:hypothetical protein
MKIALFDPYQLKFMRDSVEWWQKHGYEVKWEPYYNPELVMWADVVFFHTCDNNLTSATNPDQALKDEWKYTNRPGAWDMHEMDLTGKKIIVQPIDIEVWGGAHARDNMWDVVTDCIFIAPHIRDLMMSDSRPQASNMKLHTIPMGVNLDRWTWNKHNPGKKVAIVSEKWIIKGMQNILQIAYELPRDYEFHWVGIWSNDYPYFRDYAEDFIKRHNLNFTFYDWVDNLDEWLEDKDYMLIASIKEAFSYATAEAMAKGIKPVLHSFYGAERLWPEMTWNTPSEAVQMIISDDYDSNDYRNYLIDKGYTIDSMMEQIDKVINAI